MLQPIEVKIGNKILVNGNIETVAGIYNEGIYCLVQGCESVLSVHKTAWNQCSGIPITEELVVKIGLVCIEDLGDMKYYQIPEHVSGYGIGFDHDDLTFYRYNKFGYDTLIYDEPSFQFLHQFQNLLYSLNPNDYKKLNFNGI